MLRFADEDEAEAVYSMVALTEACRQQQEGNVQGAVIHVPESRAVKRHPLAAAVPAASACSEGGCSDSSAKSAPGPAPMRQHYALQQHQQWAAHMMQQHAQQQQGALAGSCDIHPGALGPTAPHAVSSLGLMRAMGGPAAAAWYQQGGGPAGAAAGGLPPWPMMMHPAMMSMFGGGLPMPPPPGMMMPPLPGFMCQQEPAAGIPVRGPLPPPPVLCGLVPGILAAPAVAQRAQPNSTHQGDAARSASARSASASPAPAAAAHGAARGGAASSLPRPSPQSAPATPTAQQLAAAGTPGTAASGGVDGDGAGSQQQQPGPSATAVALLAELEQLDLPSMRDAVVGQFCEGVYLLLLDAWRPDSPKVHEAIWAYKQHLKQQAAAADGGRSVRAFLVSLFGLERLLQETAAAGVAAGRSPAAAPQADAVTPAAATEADAAARACGAPVCARPTAGCCAAAATTSNLSSDPGATLTAAGPAVMASLALHHHLSGGASATSPPVAARMLQA
jgi:hypothetical protein